MDDFAEKYSVNISMIAYSKVVLLNSWGQGMDERKKKDPCTVAEEILNE